MDKTLSDPYMAGIIVYAPVINGIGGNLVAIQSSRIATHLHLHFSPGNVPLQSCYNPCHTFCLSGECPPSLPLSDMCPRTHIPILIRVSVALGPNNRSAQVLLLLVVPGHLIFLYTIHLLMGGNTTPTPVFVALFLTAALLQVRVQTTSQVSWAPALICPPH